ncbi:FUSC family protein [Pseudomonadaceae bacterium Sa2CUA2]|uniref:FUSC family protein n=2 Tax=Pseudomonas TaxID=286 RepID=A0ABR8TPJ3_9PSED|nr:FUSC family protein [Serpens gallinarum]
MAQVRPHARRWRIRASAWSIASMATVGCALPLALGLVSGHNGFLWAALGAFQASLANPLHRFGMLRMLLITLVGACSAGVGYWSGTQPLASLMLFAAMGLLLALLQRYGNEAGKLGLALAVCLCLGQGSYGEGDLHSPAAVSALFILGGLWTTLLAFILRGLHALPTWPPMPRLLAVLKVLRNHARQAPQQQWALHALACMVALGVAGWLNDVLQLGHGYWLSLTVVITLQLNVVPSFKRVLQTVVVVLIASALLTAVGHSLLTPLMLSACLLPVLFFNRALQANHYLLFSLQTTLCCLLLRESLALDWNDPQSRLLNVLLGSLLVLLVALLTHLIKRLLTRRNKAIA